MDKITIRPGTQEDIPGIVQLYDETTKYLESHINYPGWRNGAYPAEEDAKAGVVSRTLHVAVMDGNIVGSIVLNEKQEKGYSRAPWRMAADPEEVVVVHTFLVHPSARKKKIGDQLLDYAEEWAARERKKVLRLDVCERNAPAIHLYEKHGYRYVATVSLGLEEWGLPWFKLYEKPVCGRIDREMEELRPEGVCQEEMLKNLLAGIIPPSESAMEKAAGRWRHVAKPLYSLGVLEEDVIRLAGILRNSSVNIDKRAVVIMCSDNGIVEEGVTQTGREVTAVVAENMTNGDSSVCLMAERASAAVCPVDIGIASDIASGARYPLLRRKIAYGTKNFHREPAMSRDEAVRAILTGIELVRELAGEGVHLIATGEMGIGNTTTSSAVACLLLGEKPEVMTGRGAGLSDEGLERKTAVVADAVKKYDGKWKDAIDILACVGGFDIAGLAGVFLGGAIYGVPVIIDGFISATAALAAAAIAPAARDYMVASHVSAEPAGRRLLDELGVKPVIEAGMCLGEGTGAVALIPLLDMALAVYTKMSTFQEINIEEYRPFGGEI